LFATYLEIKIGFPNF